MPGKRCVCAAECGDRDRVYLGGLKRSRFSANGHPEWNRRCWCAIYGESTAEWKRFDNGSSRTDGKLQLGADAVRRLLRHAQSDLWQSSCSCSLYVYAFVPERVEWLCGELHGCGQHCRHTTGGVASSLARSCTGLRAVSVALLEKTTRKQIRHIAPFGGSHVVWSHGRVRRGKQQHSTRDTTANRKGCARHLYHSDHRDGWNHDCEDAPFPDCAMSPWVAL